MEEKIKVVAVRPGKFPVLMDIENSLSALQEFVGGYVESIRLDEDTLLICNEEGKLKFLPLNRFVINNSGKADIIAGNFILLRARVFDEGFSSLSEDQAQKFLQEFWHPEIFVGNEESLENLLQETNGLFAVHRSFNIYEGGEETQIFVLRSLVEFKLERRDLS